MRDITLKITGKQCYDNDVEDQMEFVTDGKAFERNGAVYVVYDESGVSGMDGCTTTLKLTQNTVKMKRIGEGGGTELYFEKGKRFFSKYQTPYGPMEVEVLTKWIKNDLDVECMKGGIEVEYDVSLGGMAEGKNRLKIDVM